MKRLGFAGGMIAALLATASPLAFAQPAYANVGAVAAPWAPPAPASGALSGLIKKGLVHLAVAFTNAGAAVMTNRILQAGTAPKYIGWGTGTTTAAVAQTALVTEAAPTTAGGRTVGTESRTTVTVANDNNLWSGTVTAAGTVAITEVGTFDAVSAGNMAIRADFAANNLVLNDAIAFAIGLKLVPSVV